MLSQMVGLIVSHTDDDAYVMQMVERIPDGLMPIIASVLPDEADALLRAYRDAVESKIGGYSFAHAEVVADKMR